LEVVPEAVKVMKAATAKLGLQLDWRPLPIGRNPHETAGLTVPFSTVEAVAELDGWPMGPIGHSMYPRNDRTWV
jgi:3-isopropylmalate dehydrogenase